MAITRTARAQSLLATETTNNRRLSAYDKADSTTDVPLMISLKNAIIFGLLSVPLFGFASDWQTVEYANGKTYRMDFGSIAPSGKYMKVWIETQYDTPQITDKTPLKQYGSLKVLNHFDCKVRKFAASAYLYYGAGKSKDEVVDSVQGKFSEAKLTDIVPDSLGETMLNLACDSKARAKTRAMNENIKKIVDDALKKS